MPEPPNDSAEVRELSERVMANIEKVIIGKREVVENTLVALLCGGHVLFEDIPGVGKTTLAKAFARSFDCNYKRIQFTPDLLPADVTGVSIYDQSTSSFRFRPGPVFANILLADEINRASPKTQSSLLECMEERQVTVDGITHPLPDPFLVFATQNPLEYEGVYPLPESQLDRFFLRLSIGYPTDEDEINIVKHQQQQHPFDSLAAVANDSQITRAQSLIRETHVSDALHHYVHGIVSATREHLSLFLGASPRGSLSLTRAGQARAALSGRGFVLPDDVKALAAPVLAHRLILQPEARLAGVQPEEIIREILGKVPVDERVG